MLFSLVFALLVGSGVAIARPSGPPPNGGNAPGADGGTSNQVSDGASSTGVAPGTNPGNNPGCPSGFQDIGGVCVPEPGCNIGGRISSNRWILGVAFCANLLVRRRR